MLMKKQKDKFVGILHYVYLIDYENINIMFIK